MKKIKRLFLSIILVMLSVVLVACSSTYKVTFKDCSEKKFALVESLTNSFICATTYVIMTFFKNIYISFLVAIPILIILIFLCYSLIGIYYKKKEGSKNV